VVEVGAQGYNQEPIDAAAERSIELEAFDDRIEAARFTKSGAVFIKPRGSVCVLWYSRYGALLAQLKPDEAPRGKEFVVSLTVGQQTPIIARTNRGRILAYGGGGNEQKENEDDSSHDPGVWLIEESNVKNKSTGVVIDRRPDGAWLRGPTAIAVAPNSDVAILDRGSVQVYRPNGIGRQQVELPERFVDLVAQDDQLIVVGRYNEVIVIKKRTGDLMRLRLDSKPASFWLEPNKQVLLVAPFDGGELLEYDIGQR